MKEGSRRGGAARGPGAQVASRRATRAGTGTDASRLTRDDWLDAAYDAVAAGGFDAVRVLSLAETLGITRGSFYWHFADHAALIDALVERWRHRELDADRALLARTTDDPCADLLHLLDDALARGGADLKDMRFELALRGLGRRQPGVARVLAEVDASRMRVIVERYRRLTGEERGAQDLAALLYVAVAGAHQALARPGYGARTATYLREVIADHLIRRQRPAPRDGGGALS